MPQAPETTTLAQTIRSHLLEVLPMDQEMQLEDADWRLILEALEPTDDRVIVRAVQRQLGDGYRDDDGHSVWVIDRTATAHRAPFGPGDIIIDSNGWSSGLSEILEVQPHPDEERLIRLVVRRVDGLVFDTEAF